MPHERQHNDGVRSQDEQLNELKSAALEAAANAIAITDREGIIVWVNPAFHQLTGYSNGEVIGQSIRLLKSGQHPASFSPERSGKGISSIGVRMTVCTMRT